ncbi:hypothetical protein [Brevundimonas sp.]|uniref:hypothetical protein n=1 Tax=Brevundimonas sp. TaxID=1871086 RepID=UPI003D6C950A
MKKTLMIPLLAVAAASVALPAAAQSYGDQGYDRHGDRYPGHAYEQDRYDHDGGDWRSIAQRKYNLDRRIDRGVRSRQLSHHEAARLQYELDDLVRLERHYMRGGLTRWERRDLDRRYDRLSAQIRYERRDHDDRRY